MQLPCNVGCKTRRYRVASCEVDFSEVSIEALRYDEDYEEGEEYDCRLIVDGDVVMEGEALVQYGQSIGELPCDAPLQYLEKYVQEQWPEYEIELLV